MCQPERTTRIRSMPATTCTIIGGAARDATYEDFPLLGRGPFGEAILIRKEADRDFRPFLFVPRSRLHDTPLDIKGPQASVTVVVWATWESGNHGLAGIWHEGTDLKRRFRKPPSSGCRFGSIHTPA